MAKTVYVRSPGGRTIHIRKSIQKKSAWGWVHWDYDTLCYYIHNAGGYGSLVPVEKQHIATHQLCKKCFARRKFNPDLVTKGTVRAEQEPHFRVLNTGVIHYSYEQNAINAVCGAFYRGREPNDFFMQMLVDTGYSLEECGACLARIDKHNQYQLQRELKNLMNRG